MEDKPGSRGGWWLRGWVIASAIFVFCLVVVVLLLTVPEDRFGDSAKTILLASGGLVAVVGVGLSLSRHREELDSADRDRARLAHDQNKEENRRQEYEDRRIDDRKRERQRRDDERERDVARQKEADVQRRMDHERELRGRYVAAVELLSDTEHPMKRIAGLRSLGALADDWDAFGRSGEVQVCIDTLCDYLRAAPTPIQAGESEANTPHGEIQVRVAGYQILRDHLGPTAEPYWGDRRINLSGALIDFPVNLSGIDLRGGTLDFSATQFLAWGRLGLASSTISGYGVLDLSQLNLRSASRIDLEGVQLTDSGKVLAKWAQLRDNAVLDLSRMSLDDAAGVVLTHAEVRDGSRIELERAVFRSESRLGLGWITLLGSALVNARTVMLLGESRCSLEVAEVAEKSSVTLPGATIKADGVEMHGAIAGDTGAITLPDGSRLAVPT